MLRRRVGDICSQLSFASLRYFSSSDVNKRSVDIKVYRSINKQDMHYPLNFQIKWAKNDIRRHLISEFSGTRALETFLSVQFDEINLIDCLLKERYQTKQRVVVHFTQPPLPYPNPQALTAAKELKRRFSKLKDTLKVDKLTPEQIQEELKTEISSLLGHGRDSDIIARAFAIGLQYPAPKKTFFNSLSPFLPSNQAPKSSGRLLEKMFEKGVFQSYSRLAKFYFIHNFRAIFGSNKEIPRASLRAISEPFYEAMCINAIQYEIIHGHYYALALEVRELGHQLRKFLANDSELSNDDRDIIIQGLELHANDILAEFDALTNRLYSNHDMYFPQTPFDGLERVCKLIARMKVDNVKDSNLAPTNCEDLMFECKEAYVNCNDGDSSAITPSVVLGVRRNIAHNADSKNKILGEHSDEQK